MTEKIDLRGLTCPEPVLRTKRLFDNQEVQSVEALVDDDVCVNNLKRLARTLKASITGTQRDGYYEVTISRTNGGESAQSPQPAVKKKQPAFQEAMTVIFLSKDTFGSGDPDFSSKLLNLFLQTVLDSGQEPRAILMANSGVKLMAADSQCLKVLQDFKARGTEVLACGLCVEYYGLKDAVPKEQITNMFAISEYLFAADKVLTP